MRDFEAYIQLAYNCLVSFRVVKFIRGEAELFCCSRTVSWQSKLQKCVALSTTEAEYIAATEAAKEMLWMKRFVQELGLMQDEYVVFCDSQSVMDLSKNTSYHSRTKHIDVRYHWLRDIIGKELMKLKKIHTDFNPSDMMTKVVTREKLKLCAGSAGMDSN